MLEHVETNVKPAEWGSVSPGGIVQPVDVCDPDTLGQ